MIKLTVVSVNTNTGVCIGKTDKNEVIKFSFFGLQEGKDQPYLYDKIYEGSSVYIDEDSKGSDGSSVVQRFYLRPIKQEFEEAIKALKHQYGKKRDYPLVGDLVIDENGKMARVTILDRDKVQFHAGSSFHFGRVCGDGSVGVQQSGSCGFSEDVKDLLDTGALEPATFWAFRNFDVGAHNGVQYDVKVKVWKFKRRI